MKRPPKMNGPTESYCITKTEKMLPLETELAHYKEDPVYEAIEKVKHTQKTRKLKSVYGSTIIIKKVKNMTQT